MLSFKSKFIIGSFLIFCTFSAVATITDSGDVQELNGNLSIGTMPSDSEQLILK